MTMFPMETVKYIRIIRAMIPMSASKRRSRPRKEITTISLTRNTYERLNGFRRGGESWDQFLARVAHRLDEPREAVT